MSILKKLEMFRSVTGYLGAGVFTPEGKMLAGVTDISGISFEIAGSYFHDSFVITDNKSREVGFGYVNTLQVDTEMGVVFGRSFKTDDVHFRIILVVRNDANVAMAKLMLNRVGESLEEDIKRMNL